MPEHLPGLLLTDVLSLPLERTHPFARVEQARFLAAVLCGACTGLDAAPALPAPAANAGAVEATTDTSADKKTDTNSDAVDVAAAAVSNLSLNSRAAQSVLSHVGSLVCVQRICFLFGSNHDVLHKEAMAALFAAEVLVNEQIWGC